MKVLIVSTNRPSLRDDIHGWDVEDSDLYKPDKPIGLTPSPQMGWASLENPDPKWFPRTMLEALYYGWKLLGAPVEQKYDVDGKEMSHWDWWLAKE